MSVKEHYDNHLGYIYSWYMGDFQQNIETFITFCKKHQISPSKTKNAIDLGAGNGIQSIALAQLGYKVKAIDFNTQLLKELEANKGDESIDIIQDDMLNVRNYASAIPELILCCGDTLPHLQSKEEIYTLLKDCYNILCEKGKILLTFRDYHAELTGDQRFIPVKSDSSRILTCFIEYFPEKIRVTDLLNELEHNKWVQKVSSYFKTRILQEEIEEYFTNIGFKVLYSKMENRIVSILGQKI